jgi:hypothetical protein
MWSGVKVTRWAHNPKLIVRFYSPQLIKEIIDMVKKEVIKMLRIISGPNIRILLQEANSIDIQKEDIVQIISQEGQYIMVYYG